MRYLKLFWNYLRLRQNPLILYLHVLVFSLVIVQIIDSNFMQISRAGEIGQDTVDFYGTWTHIVVGLTAMVATLVFVCSTLKIHGFRYFFPYLAGDVSQLRADVKDLRRLVLPEPLPGGLAALVKGLGLGALLLVVLSGSAWFGAWWFDLGWAGNAREVHQFMTTFIEIYIVAHGGMALIHIFFSHRLQQRR